MKKLLMLLLIALLAATAVPPTLAQNEPIIHAVMFWMDGCPHCHDVLDTVLPPLQMQYGDQLDIVLVEIITIEDTEQLYLLGDSLGLEKNDIGVPLLLIGDAVLVGSDQIRDQLPAKIIAYLEVGGVAIPGYPTLIPLLPVGTETAVFPQTTSPKKMGTTTNNNGFTLAIIMLMGMIIAVIYTGIRFWRAWRGHTTIHSPAWVQWTIPLLAVIGLIIAAYLAYVESQAIAAMCGPIGDCNTVQTSDYAYLFGIPIGVLGVLGYITTLLVWAWGKWQAARSAILLLLGMTTIGVLFSIYLTYLEPFIIGAVCAWCLTSAGIMTLLMLASVETAVSNLSRVQDGD